MASHSATRTRRMGQRVIWRVSRAEYWPREVETTADEVAEEVHQRREPVDDPPEDSPEAPDT